MAQPIYDDSYNPADLKVAISELLVATADGSDELVDGAVPEVLRLLRQQPVKHAQHWCDANAAADQHHRRMALIDMEMPGWRAHLQLAADGHLVVKIA